jgi:hypothetical protein
VWFSIAGDILASLDQLVGELLGLVGHELPDVDRHIDETEQTGGQAPLEHYFRFGLGHSRPSRPILLAS